MDKANYRARFHQALSRAFAAHSSEERAAYFDLATLYREKLNGPADLFPRASDYQDWLRS